MFNDTWQTFYLFKIDKKSCISSNYFSDQYTLSIYIQIKEICDQKVTLHCGVINGKNLQSIVTYLCAIRYIEKTSNKAKTGLQFIGNSLGKKST